MLCCEQLGSICLALGTSTVILWIHGCHWTITRHIHVHFHCIFHGGEICLFYLVKNTECILKVGKTSCVHLSCSCGTNLSGSIASALNMATVSKLKPEKRSSALQLVQHAAARLLSGTRSRDHRARRFVRSPLASHCILGPIQGVSVKFWSPHWLGVSPLMSLFRSSGGVL